MRFRPSPGAGLIRSRPLPGSRSTIELHRFDLPDGVDLGEVIAVDTETMGLDPHRDRLCLVQLSAGDGTAHLVHFPEPRYDAPNLKALVGDKARTKLFHYARFDLAVLRHYLGVSAVPLYCTKIASKLARTYTDRHGLKDLCKDLLNVELSKQQQSSDWGAAQLSRAQLKYAGQDVLHLHALRERLDGILDREGRRQLAEACFRFVPTRVELDLGGWVAEDIFEH